LAAPHLARDVQRQPCLTSVEPSAPFLLAHARSQLHQSVKILLSRTIEFVGFFFRH
jgi:hypothetical protein